MNSTDQQIDRALHALRHAVPRDGMDQRLLARLNDRAAVPASSWRAVLTFAPPVAALFTAALLFVIFHHAQRTATPTTAQATNQPAPAANYVIPQVVQPLVVSQINHVSGPALRASIAEKSFPVAEIDPAYLPSFPAPQAPLTSDERRLISLARHSGTYDVAQFEAPPESLLRQRQDSVGYFIHHMLAPLVTAESFNPTPEVEHDPPP